QYEGEARFMRALFYFDLVRVFGGVPGVTTVLTIEETKNIARSSAEEIYGLIEEDLLAAIDLLPERTDIAKGRASREAATAVWRKVYVYTQASEQAQSALDRVIGYDVELMDGFGDLWKEEFADNYEVIFAMQYISNDNGDGLSRDVLPDLG